MIEKIENMKTLFAIDCTISLNGNNLYFSKLRDIKNKYYNISRGDKFYIWGDGYFCKNESEIEAFILVKCGFFKERHGYYIAEIGKETKSENFEHLIIITDGSVDSHDIDESDRRVHEYGLHFKYVSYYIIGSNGDESVGCPYARGNPNTIYIIDNDGNEKCYLGK